MARVKQEYQQSLTEFSAAHREEVISRIILFGCSTFPKITPFLSKEMKVMVNKTNLKIAGLMDFAPEKAYTVRDNLGC